VYLKKLDVKKCLYVKKEGKEEGKKAEEAAMESDTYA
jgi:hypothetical protein